MKQILIILIFVISLFFPLINVLAGTILDSHQYAWSNNSGYLNFENVIVNDNNLTGFAWSANKGFIILNPLLGGVQNDGAGNLSGSAWGEQLGWIDFSDVSIDDNGKFSGSATGELIGVITFDCPNYCDVETDWRPAVVSNVSSGGGGGPSLISEPILITTPIPFEPVVESTRSAQARLIDIQQDGIINILDFNTLIVNWGSTENLSADMNKDGVVDILDFNMLMVYWNVRYQI